ncbi:hypothetical protein O1611_g5872 [Lasiodiplodia mahajangana]|uniref:Uncharacterized protein n=1 Tax=Lasiodiplodia mahajangana TaxID=1108764 RepID=A0ACC2JJY4_9PEZI|nr:hypothetical protein O1611_g5872 [Lasiodiplodia mahajangana]
MPWQKLGRHYGRRVPKSIGRGPSRTPRAVAEALTQLVARQQKESSLEYRKAHTLDLTMAYNMSFPNASSQTDRGEQSHDQENGQNHHTPREEARPAGGRPRSTPDHHSAGAASA